nr:transposase [Chryseobacterium echinoideorum]
MDIKEIHLGVIIRQGVIENNIETSRICNFFKCSEKDIEEMYESKSLDTEILLRWSKLLEYDFFRIYTQHLILYAPQGNTQSKDVSDEKKSQLPQFRKNVYTKELIDFILERIKNGEMTKLQVINEYKIPKTTLYKWIEKYSSK